jgi:glycogen operon protein
LLEKNAQFFRFVKEIIAFRRRHPGFMRPEFYSGRNGSYNAIPDITWYDETGKTPDWDNIGHCMAFRMDGSRAEIKADRDDNDFYIMLNGGNKRTVFSICDPLRGKRWVRAVDTALPSPEDILIPGTEKELQYLRQYIVQARSMVVLISKYIESGGKIPVL